MMIDTLKHRPGNRIAVLFCCNPGYYQHLAVAITSMLRNNRQHLFDIYVLSTAFDFHAEEKLRRSLEIHKNASIDLRYVHTDQISHFFVSAYITHETYIRILAAEILEPTISKVLYLDSDLVVVDDISELWMTDIDDYILAGVPDPYGDYRRHELGIPADAPYINAGVLLLNLQRWRAQDLTRRLFRYIEDQGSRLMFWDQDAINSLLYNCTRLLDYRWNVQARMFKIHPRQTPPTYDLILRAIKDPAIIHYNGEHKPWQFLSTVAKKDIYSRYLRQTAWRGTRPEGRTLKNMPRYALRQLRSKIGFLYRPLLRRLLVWTAKRAG